MQPVKPLSRFSRVHRRPFIPWWRRQYLVNRDMQTRFARNGVIVGLTSSVLSAGMILWSFWAFNIWQGQRLPVPVMVVFAAVVFINVSSIYVAGVIATQRIAGPLFNLLRQFSRVEAGDFSAFAKFREGDEIHYVAKRFNEMVKILKDRQDNAIKNVDLAVESMNRHEYRKAQETLTVIREVLSENHSHERVMQHVIRPGPPANK